MTDESGQPKNTQEEIFNELDQRNTSQHVGTRHDPHSERGLVGYDTVQTSDRVDEEHVYLSFMNPQSGKEEIWEADLIGLMREKSGRGVLPPLIYVECPFCTDPIQRNTMTIDMKNKHYEIEPVADPAIKQFLGPDGQPVALPIDRLLHIREQIRCPFCTVSFTIRGGTIQRVK